MDVPELLSIPPPTQQLEDVHAPFVFEILLICFNDIDCIDYYLLQNEKKWKKKNVTLDMVPSPSTWNPRPSTLDKKIDSQAPRGAYFFKYFWGVGGGGGLIERGA